MADNDNASLLAHLAFKFTKQTTETLATEALCYILSQSTACRGALRETMRTGGAEVGLIENFETEVKGEKDERLDLVGFDEHGFERVLIEAKFWAGLTDNQPNTYLERLQRDGKPAVLLFVAPEARLESLWTEVLRRADEKFNLGADTVAEGIRSAIVDGSERRLMLTSWRALLGGMSSRVGVDGDSSAERDILQLNALCERQDSEAFLPLRPEEFGPAFPRRMLNLQKLVDDATERAREEGFVDTTGLKVTPQAYGYGRYLRVGGADSAWAQAWFGVHYKLWARDEETPLWLYFVNSLDKGSPDLSKEDIFDKFGYDREDFVLPTGLEYEAVLDSVVEQLHDIAEDIGRSEQ